MEAEVAAWILTGTIVALTLMLVYALWMSIFRKKNISHRIGGKYKN
ncbi:MAG TPA: hypothetical protein VG347_02470 [Verrucomicrobiae bacterium]|nr:hypothetical protein [Verrucomicrobiae bacterium]